MARESFARLMLLTYRALEVLMTFLFPAWYGPSARYRPENDYMRGPGPKWRAKYLAELSLPHAVDHLFAPWTGMIARSMADLRHCLSQRPIGKSST